MGACTRLANLQSDCRKDVNVHIRCVFIEFKANVIYSHLDMACTCRLVLTQSAGGYFQYSVLIFMQENWTKDKQKKGCPIALCC